MRPSLAAARLRNALVDSDRFTRTPTCTRCQQSFPAPRDAHGFAVPVLKTEAVCSSCAPVPVPTLEPQS